MTSKPTASIVRVMAHSGVLKDDKFQLVNEYVQPDAKRRLSLGEAAGGVDGYSIYRNSLGQIILDPVRVIPASEMWLFENPAALAGVKKGLRESAEGKRLDRGSFAKHAKE